MDEHNPATTMNAGKGASGALKKNVIYDCMKALIISGT